MDAEHRQRHSEAVTPEDVQLERALDEFVTARDAGTAPDIDQYVERFPRIANRLRDCLSGLIAADAAGRGLIGDLSPSIPKRLGDFRILAKIGRGGMGEVYRAEQVSLDRPVALKVLPGSWGWTPLSKERFHREAQAAARLHHTNIVAVYAEGEQDGVCYYAMELIDGPSLDQLISALRDPSSPAEGSVLGSRTHGSQPSGSQPPDGTSRRPLPIAKEVGELPGCIKAARDRFETTARWIASVAEALQYAHQQGVIHRDVKPSNLMLGQDARVRLTDFGLARLADQPGMTITGEMLGTPRYMSPEQVAAGRMSVDARTDVYSLGVTLYELLTLEPPFAGTSRDQTIAQVISQEPKRPRQIDSAIPVDLETICLKAMEKDAGRRYQTAGDLAADLRRYSDRFAILAKRTTLPGRLVKWSRRHPALAIVSTCLILSACAVAHLGWKARDQAHQMANERRQNAIEHAILAVMSGDTQSAEQAVVQAELHGAKRGWVRMLEGQIAFARGDVAQAQRQFEQAIRLMPDSVAAHALLGRMYLFNGAWEDGHEVKSRLASLAPRSAEDRLFLAYYQSVYDPVQTEATLNQVIAERDSSVARLIRAGGLANLAQLTGDVQAAQRSTTDAEAAYAMLAEGNQLATAICIEAHNAAASAYAMAGDDAKREVHLARAGQLVAEIDHRKAIPQLLCHAAFYWDRRGDSEQALAAWKRAAKTGWTRCVKNYVCELYRAGRFAEALHACDLAGEKQRDTNLETLRPLLLAELGRDAEAMAELKRIAGSDAKPEVKIYLAHSARIIGRSDWADDMMRNVQLPPGSYLPQEFAAFNAGKLTADELLASCDNRFERADASFQIAHRQLAEGDAPAAAESFRVIEQLNPYYHHEYRWSRALLQRIESDPQWPGSIQIAPE